MEIEELCRNLPCQNLIVPGTDYCVTCNKVAELEKKWIAQGGGRKFKKCKECKEVANDNPQR